MRKKLVSAVAILTFASIAPAFAAIGIFDANVDVDNGSLGAAGSATYDADSDTYTIEGSGQDTWNDVGSNFHFVYKEWSGDFNLVADVTVGGNEGQDWIKSMLMCAQGLGGWDNYITTRVRRDGQYSTQWRTGGEGSDGSTASDLRVSGLNPATQRLERVGDTFTTYYKDETGAWVVIDSNECVLTDPVLVGFGVCAHDLGAIATGTFSNVYLGVNAVDAPVGVFENTVTLDALEYDNTPLAGSITEADGVYTISGDGRDIWDNGDEGFFAYTELSGANSISAKVKWINGGIGNDWSKIGVMVRENGNDPASKHYWIEMRSGAEDADGNALGDRTDAQWRDATGQSSGNVEIPSDGANMASVDGMWFRVTREGDNFTSEYSMDGSAWSVANTRSIPMQDEVAYGVIITSHCTTAVEGNELVTAEVSDVQIEAIPVPGYRFDHPEWVLEDGVMKNISTERLDPKHLWVNQDIPQDCTLKCDVKVVEWNEGDDWSRCGIGGRLAPVDGRVEGLNLLFHQNAGNVQFLNDYSGWGPNAAIPWAPGIWYTLTLNIEGTMLSGSFGVKGAPPVEMEPWESAGTVRTGTGFGLAGNSDVGVTYYDNFSISVDGEVIFSDSFDDPSSMANWEILQ